MTLIAIAAQSHSSFSVFFIIIGIAVIYLSLANASQATYERIHKHAVSDIDWTVRKYGERTDQVVIVGSLILFGLSMFIPLLSANPITDALFDALNWACELSIVGMIIKGIGIVNLVGIAMGGYLFSLRLLTMMGITWTSERK